MSIRILIVDDQQILRQGLRTMLEKQPGMTVVGEAENGRTAIELAGELSPTVIVMDVAMPDLNGIEATSQIVEAHPRVKVIALSMHSDKQFVSRMFKAGAVGYLLKDCAVDELAEAIRTVIRDQAYIGRTISSVVLDDYVQQLRRPPEVDTAELTPREREVLQLIAEGHSTKEIAFTLEISSKTVETHRRNMMEKLDVDSVAELTKFAIRRGITTLDG